MVAAGLGLAVLGFGGRYVMRQLPNVAKTMQEAMKSMPKIDGNTIAGSRYYKGGFDPKMSRREAALILGELIKTSKNGYELIIDIFLGISPTSNKGRVKDAFKKVMSQNHPDRGGSPYLAAKINEAKDFMENNKS